MPPSPVPVRRRKLQSGTSTASSRSGVFDDDTTLGTRVLDGGCPVPASMPPVRPAFSGVAFGGHQRV